MWYADVFAKYALPLSVTVVSEYSTHWADVRHLCVTCRRSASSLMPEA